MSQKRSEQEEAAQGHGLFRAPGGAEFIEVAEEAAQGQDLYRAPGQARFLGEAQDQAAASGWITDDTVSFPSDTTREGVMNRRQEIYEAMRRLEAAVARPSGLADWRIVIESALIELHASVDEHVAQVEGDGGLFDQIIREAPYLDAAVRDLTEEHQELLGASSTALSMVGDWDIGVLRRKVNGLLARLAMHRQTGAELLYDAYNVDVGGRG